MKKITVLCSAFCLFMVLSTVSLAQQAQNVIKINPLSLAVANISLSYERAVSDNKSFLMHGAYWMGFSVNDAKFDGFTLSPEFRFYVTDHGVPEGFYLGPYGRYESLTGRDKTNTDATVTLSRIGAGVNVGYQFFFGERVTLDMFAGPKYLSNSVSVKNATEDDFDLDRFGSGFGFRWGVTVGIAF